MCFGKVLQTTRFNAIFVSPTWVFWNDGFPWIEHVKKCHVQFAGTLNFPKKTHNCPHMLCATCVMGWRWRHHELNALLFIMSFCDLHPLTSLDVKTRRIFDIFRLLRGIKIITRNYPRRARRAQKTLSSISEDIQSTATTCRIRFETCWLIQQWEHH